VRSKRREDKDISSQQFDKPNKSLQYTSAGLRGSRNNLAFRPTNETERDSIAFDNLTERVNLHSVHAIRRRLVRN